MDLSGFLSWDIFALYIEVHFRICVFIFHFLRFAIQDWCMDSKRRL